MTPLFFYKQLLVQHMKKKQALGRFFCLFAAFAVAKTIRDGHGVELMERSRPATEAGRP